MVYCGKPSSACRQCRKRNIKCDKKKGSCGQCLRAQLLCPGYHDPKNLIFRDETKTVLQKVREMKSTPIQAAPLPPFEHRAKDLFISQYVMEKSAPFHYMSSFWPPNSDNTHLTVTIRAVSLASFSNRHLSSSASILDRARRHYSTALELTNQALRYQETATRNVTLHTVLLLALFERLMGNDQSSVEAESRHLDGAITLVRLRGRDQLNDPVAKRILSQLYPMVIRNYNERHIDVPADILNFQKSCTSN